MANDGGTADLGGAPGRGVVNGGGGFDLVGITDLVGMAGGGTSNGEAAGLNRAAGGKVITDRAGGMVVVCGNTDLIVASGGGVGDDDGAIG